MTRDLERLGRDLFDLLVVGGGIYGLATARDAAARGLSVALVERGDFGSATSFNHHKTLHGGLRYLQRGDLRRMRESVRERRAFAWVAPQFVRPLAFLLPTSRSLARGRLALRAAMAVDRAVGYDRNRGVAPHLRLEPGRVVPRAELERLAPELAQAGATGAALWHEYKTEESERLTLAVALAAAREGALLANYVEAVAPCREGGQITGMQVRDLVSGERHVIRARLTCNAAGPGAGRILAGFGIRRPFPLLKAMNVVTARPAGAVACGVRSDGGRMLVALPWRGRLAVGTWHGHELAGADASAVDGGELDAFLAEINRAMPWLALARADVTLVHRGLVPAQRTRTGPPRFLERSRVEDHAREGLEGALSVVGVKYTTARATAERAVDLALAKLRMRHVESRTAVEPLLSDAPEGSAPPGDELASILPQYDGDAATRLTALVRERPGLGAPLAAGVPAVGAQVLEAVRHEMALSLEDVVLRRTALGSAGYPGDAAVRAAAGIMGAELGWSSERVESEVEGVRRYYDLPDGPPPDR